MARTWLVVVVLLLCVLCATFVTPVEGAKSKEVKTPATKETPVDDMVEEKIEKKKKKKKDKETAAGSAADGEKKKKKKKKPHEIPEAAQEAAAAATAHFEAQEAQKAKEAPKVEKKEKARDADTPVVTKTKESPKDLPKETPQNVPKQEDPAVEKEKAKQAARAKFAERQRKYHSRVKKQEETRSKKVKTRLDRAAKVNTKHASERKTKKKAKEEAEAKVYKSRDETENKRKSSDTPEMRGRGLKKLQWLQKEAAKSSTNIISLDAEAYKEYVNNGPRPYYLFLAFTALTPQHQCTTCRWARNGMVPLAESHGARRKLNSTIAFTDDLQQMPIFFVEVDVLKNREIFDKLSINSAPIVCIVPPKLNERSDKINEFLKKLPMKYRFTALTPTLTGDDLNVWIGKVINIHVQMQEGAIPYEIVALLVILLLIFGFVAFKFQSGILLVLRSNRVMMMVGLWLGYLFCISGGMYNYIRQTQWAGYGKDGEQFNIAPDGHDQYVMESYIVGFVTLMCGVACVLLIRATFDASDGAPKSTTKKVASGVFNLVLSPIICFAVCALFWYQLLRIYSQKTYGYNMGWLS